MAKTVPAGYAAAKATLTIKPINYGVVQISWDAITDPNLPSINGSIGGSFPKFTLVRKASGYPQGIADGTIIRQVNNLNPAVSPYTYVNFGVTANYFVFDAGNTQYTEVNPPAYGTTSTDIQGETMYYALFLAWPDSGTVPFRNQKIAEGKAIFVENRGTLDVMLNHLPELYKRSSSGSENTDLKSFLSLFAFYYDLARTQTTTVFNTTDVSKTDIEFLKKLLNQFGGSYENVQDPSLARTVLENIAYLSKSRGSFEGIEEFIKAYTGYIPSLTAGKNHVHDYNSSSFEESTGFWWPDVSNATTPYGLAYNYSAGNKASGLSQVGPVATGTVQIQAFSNRKGVTLTSANCTTSSTIVTVASTAGLTPGSLVEFAGTAGVGALAKGTVVVNILSSTTFTINVVPTTALVGADLYTSDNMITGMMKLTAPNSGDNKITLGPKRVKLTGTKVAGQTSLVLEANIAEKYDYVIHSSIPYGTYITTVNYSTSTVVLSNAITATINAGEEIWLSKTASDKAGASTAFLPVSAPTEPHTFSMYVNRAGGTAVDVEVTLVWRDIKGDIISSSSTAILTAGTQTLTTAWYRVVSTDNAPAGAVYCEPVVKFKGMVSGDIYFIDAVQWEYGIEVYSFGVNGGVATVVTKNPHNFSTSNKVGIKNFGVETIASVPTTTSFTYSTALSPLIWTLGNCSSSGQLITIPQTPINNIAIGSPVTVTSGTGAFAPNTVVVDVLNEYTIYVDQVPTTPLSGATITFSQVAISIVAPYATKVSSVTPFEDAKITYIDISGTSINEITDPTLWHSTTSKNSFTSTAASLNPTTAAGTVTFAFTGASGAFGAVADSFNLPIQITQAVGSGNSITYTTSGSHDFLVGKTPTIYNMANFFSSDPINAGRGNGFDIKPINAATVPIVSATDTTFTVQKAPITLTGVTSYTSPSTSAPYIVISGANYDQLWVGAKVRVTSGTGNLSLSPSGSSTTTSIIKNEYNPATSRNDIFYLDVVPATALSGATIEASLGTGGLSSTSLNSGLPTAIASYDISYAKGRNIYYNTNSNAYGNFYGIPVETGVSYTFAMSKSHTLPSSGGYGYQTYSPYVGTYLYSGFMCLPYIEFNNGVTNTSKAPMAALVRKISRKNNITTFTTSGPHNFKVGDLIHFSNVRVTPTGLSQVNYSHDSISATTTGVPHYVQSVTPTSFSTRHSYAATSTSTPTYSYDGLDFSTTSVDLVPTGSGSYYPPLAGYAVTTYIPENNYMSMTAYPYSPRTTVPWDVDDSKFHRAIPGFYLVELFGTPSSQPNHTVVISKTFFSASTDFLYFFDGINDPNNRVGGYLDTLWEGAAGNSRSHYYLNLASTSNRLQTALADAVTFANHKIDFPNKTAKLSAASVNAGGNEITFTCSTEHDFAVNGTIAVTGFTGNTAVNVTRGKIVSAPSSSKIVVVPETTPISTAAVTGTGTAYVTNGWSGIYRVRYADPTYTSPYSSAFGFAYGIFTLNSSLLDGPDTLTY